ncbi:hypothetical protein WJX73_006444 [Symbiochloris irregularis]|uniref:Uncharacterized protein n=1 Tax=Symbiochloris irregularis TaxID=706552 RepID=A0AAW1NR30_9CHLO
MTSLSFGSTALRQQAASLNFTGRGLCFRFALNLHSYGRPDTSRSLKQGCTLPLRAQQPFRQKGLQLRAMASANGAAADERVVQLRAKLKEAKVDAYIIPTADAHQSEYPAECDARRAWISHFTGSAGTAVVTQQHALLWTDGRYFLQAEKQLPKGWTLMRAGTPTCPEISDWLASNLPEGSVVGIDPLLHTVSGAQELHQRLENEERRLQPLGGVNLVDSVWGAARPAPPAAPLRIHTLEHAGASVRDKLGRMRKELAEAKAGALLVTALDEVAWLLNLRGGDVAHNPVFISYALLTTTSAAVYVDSSKVTPEVQAHLEEAGVEIKPYDALLSDVKSLAAAGKRIWTDPDKVSFAVKTVALEGATGGSRGKGKKRTRSGAATADDAGDAKVRRAAVLEKPSPVTAAKAVKTAAELKGMREAHLRDAVALAQTLHWIETEVGQGGRTITEVEVDEYLTGRRAAQAGFVETSFPTIAGAGPNGAIIHYRAESSSCASVDSNTLLLVDSGGQYDCGTTDVTRTLHTGQPSTHQRICFTRVLQGHIGLDQAVFPEGTHGLALDILARAPLWEMGLNYRHGTGHGVGAALNVHEGPQSISHRIGSAGTPLAVGMVLSNEPGYYEDGAFGVRIENLLVVKEASTPFKFGGQAYLGFERLTWCPLQRKMLAPEVMTQREVDWVDEYHKEVWEKVSPRLQDQPQVLEWLHINTAPLELQAEHLGKKQPALAMA